MYGKITEIDGIGVTYVYSEPTLSTSILNLCYLRLILNNVTYVYSEPTLSTSILNLRYLRLFWTYICDGIDVTWLRQSWLCD